MFFPEMAAVTGLESALFSAFVFAPLERAFPAKNQPFFRAGWSTDLAFFLGQYLLWNGGVFTLLELFQSSLNGIAPHAFRAAISSQAWAWQAVEVVFLSDFFVYWGHRLQHRADILWRFHAIHHSAEHLDWLAAHREHPLDTIYTIGLINLPAFIMGFPIPTLGFLLAFRGIWAIYLHSNVRLPIGPLRVLIGAPELHHWHHSRERYSCNYGNICPLMDILFGSYRCPPHEPEALGVSEKMPRGYLGQILYPFQRRRPRQSVSAGTEEAG